MRKCRVTGTPRNRTSAESTHSEPAPDAARETASGRVTTQSSAHDSPSSTQARVPLWKYRPFTRVVRGFKAYKIVRDYIQLNEKEATGEIRYSKQRLRGLRAEALARLWT
jgi:hypothetical protein